MNTKLGLISDVGGLPTDPGFVPLREDTPDVPVGNPWYGSVNIKLVPPDVDPRMAGMLDVRDARQLYNIAATAANNGLVLQLNSPGTMAWTTVSDPGALALALKQKYNLTPDE